MSNGSDNNTLIMSVDVEDWFQVENLRSIYPPDGWDSINVRLRTGMDLLLSLFDEKSVTATFYIVGYIAEKYSDIVRQLASTNHEIGLHTYNHCLLSEYTPPEFREDLHRCRSIIEDISGKAVEGFRAPALSITEWALDILAEEGLKYDSSYVHSNFNPRFGKVQCMEKVKNPDTPWMIREGLLELPLPTLFLGGLRMPWYGGGYFRLIPYPVFKSGVDWIVNRHGYFQLFVHPWELDPNQPFVKNLPLANRFRHYVNLSRTYSKLERLLSDYKFISTSEAIHKLHIH